MRRELDGVACWGERAGTGEQRQQARTLLLSLRSVLSFARVFWATIWRIVFFGLKFLVSLARNGHLRLRGSQVVSSWVCDETLVVRVFT